MNKSSILFKPYASLLFLDNWFVGLILFLLSFINPSVGISGLLALIFTVLFAEFIDFRESYLENGFYLYNSLLVGMGVGYLFSPTILSISFIMVLSVFTFLLSYVLYNIFSNYKIPILSLPFSIVTMIVYLASVQYKYMFSNLNNYMIFDISISPFIDAFFKSFGTIFFLPNVLAGGIIFFIVLFFSRIMAFISLFAFTMGIFIHSLAIGSFIEELNNPYSFNYILVSIALGGVFLLPTLKNYILAMIGVLISIVLVDAMVMVFNQFSLPVFTMPFNIVVMIFLFVLGSIKYKEFNFNIKSTPEESFSFYLSNIFRFGSTDIKIALPFFNEWVVYQSFDDEWTHKGKWKYAYDFVIKKDGKSYKNDGLYPSDYYCFGESVSSPINGYVVDKYDNLVDNIIGEVDRVNNWGNYIIIKSDSGYFVEISHLMKDSIIPKVGEYVLQGQIIAKCGNSGYSPEPHLHIQVQKYGFIGSETIPFLFNEYYMNNELFFNSLPKKNSIVKSFIVNKYIQFRFNFILDEEYKYEIIKNDEKISEFSFKVNMNEKGEFFFIDQDNNKLYFHNNGDMFYFYFYTGNDSYLKEIFKMAPKIPFISDKVTYRDYLPIYILETKMKTILIEFLSTFNKNLYKRERFYLLNRVFLTSEYGEVYFSLYEKGFEKFVFKNIELRRIDNIS